MEISLHLQDMLNLILKPLNKFTKDLAYKMVGVRLKVHIIEHPCNKSQQGMCVLLALSSMETCIKDFHKMNRPIHPISYSA